MHKFLENIKTTYGNISTNLGAETTVADTIESTTYVNMAYYDLYTAIAHVTNAATSVVLTLRLWEATAAAGTGSQSLAITDTFTAAATSDTDVLIAQVRGDQLTAGYSFVGCRLSTSSASGAEKVGMVQTQARARYAQATLP